MNLAKPFAVLAAIGVVQGCTLVKTVLHNTPSLDDYRIFANRVVSTAQAPSPLRTLPMNIPARAGTRRSLLPPGEGLGRAKRGGRRREETPRSWSQFATHAPWRLSRIPGFMARLQVPDENGAIHELNRYLDDTSTVAFVVMRDDRIVYERSLLNSFSIAKPIVATLAGIAVSERRLQLDATVAMYRPDFAGTPYGAVTVRSLLTMTSGMGDAPSYLPGRAQFYYGDDLHDVVARAAPESRAENGWRYSEADVQMLGFVLEAATSKPVSAYLAEKLWKPLGMESPALWALDREGGVEKTFCCISARARDFARFGRLYLEAGRWNGKQIVPAEWAARTVLHGTRTKDGYLHQHLWWTPRGGQGDFFAYGHNGQYVYVNPALRTVIVKFSENKRQDPVPMFREIASALRSPSNLAEIERIEAAAITLR